MSACAQCDYQKSKGTLPTVATGRGGVSFKVEAYCKDCRAKLRQMARDEHSPIKITKEVKARYAKRQEAWTPEQLSLGWQP